MTTPTGSAWSEDPLGDSPAHARVSLDDGPSLLLGRTGAIASREGVDAALLAAVRDRVVLAEAELGEPAQLRWRVSDADVNINDALTVEAIGPISDGLPWGVMEPLGVDQWGWEGHPESPSDSWSRANAGEVFPGVMTPLTWSLTGAALDRGFSTPWGRKARGRRFVALFDGYVYFNLGLILDMLGNGLGMRTADFLQAVGGPEAQGVGAAESQEGSPPEHPPTQETAPSQKPPTQETAPSGQPPQSSETAPSGQPPYAGGPPRRAAGGSGRTPSSTRDSEPTPDAPQPPPSEQPPYAGGPPRRAAGGSGQTPSSTRDSEPTPDAPQPPPSGQPPYAGGPPRGAAGGSARTPSHTRDSEPTPPPATQAPPLHRGGVPEGTPPQRPPAITDRPNWWRLFVNLPFLTWRAAVQRWLPLRWPHERAAADRERAALRAIGAEASDGEILRALRRSAQFSSDFVVFLMQCQSAAFGQIQFLLWLSESWTGERALALRLLQGLPNVLTAESNLELWRLAERAAADAPAAALIAATPAEELLAALDADSQASWLAAELRDFLAAHGHRTTAELELSTPRWVEQPAPLLATFRDYALHPQQSSLERLRERQVADRKAAEAQARRALTARPLERWLPARWLFYLLVVRDAQALQPLRENPKYVLMQLSLEQRRLYLLLGERWRARGALEAAEDIFWLLGEETLTLARRMDEPAVRGRMRSRVRRRGRQYEEWSAQTPPPLRDRSGEPIVSAAEAAAADSEAAQETGPMRGIAASAGVARGRARVATSPAEGRELVAGEVLVARFTDPGWTPIFPLASAVVTEIGGMLSHGAVVAREYGIPAVVNVRAATKRIQTGDEVEVDGSAGVVRLV